VCFAGLLLLTPSASFHIAASFIFQLSPSEISRLEVPAQNGSGSSFSELE